MTEPPVRTGDRVFALSSFFALATVLWVAVAQPFRAWHLGLADEIANELMLSARLQEGIAHGGQALSNGAIETLRARSAIFLEGPNDAIVGAELQQRLAKIAIKHGVEIGRVEALALRTVDHATNLGLKVELRAEPKPLHSFLRELETSTPYLFVERAHLRLEAPERPTGEAARVKIQRTRMIADIEVFGVKWSEPIANSIEGVTSP